MFAQRIFRLQSVTGSKPFVIAPFTVFQSTGMIMARPVPVQLSPENPSQIAREGYVSLVVIPRVPETGSGQFEKDKRISVKLRAKQIGQLIAWRGLIPTNGSNARTNPSTSLTLTAYAGSVPVSLDIKPSGVEDATATEPMLQLTLSPKSGDVSPVSVPISVGEMKAFQVLLESCLPNLYGWTWKSTAPKPPTSTTMTTSKSPEDFFKQFTASG